MLANGTALIANDFSPVYVSLLHIVFGHRFVSLIVLRMYCNCFLLDFMYMAFLFCSIHERDPLGSGRNLHLSLLDISLLSIFPSKGTLVTFFFIIFACWNWHEAMLMFQTGRVAEFYRTRTSFSIY
jgi:hypothetical protein